MRLSIMQKSSDRSRAEDFFALLHFCLRAFADQAFHCLHKTGEPAASALRTIDDGWIRIFADPDIFRYQAAVSY